MFIDFVEGATLIVLEELRKIGYLGVREMNVSYSSTAIDGRTWKTNKFTEDKGKAKRIDVASPDLRFGFEIKRTREELYSSLKSATGTNFYACKINYLVMPGEEYNGNVVQKLDREKLSHVGVLLIWNDSSISIARKASNNLNWPFYRSIEDILYSDAELKEKDETLFDNFGGNSRETGSLLCANLIFGYPCFAK